MKYMLDTNICIYAMKKQTAVLQKLTSIDPDEICISSITLSELMYGIQKSGHKDENTSKLLNFLAVVSVLDYGGNASLSYGKIRTQLEKQGQPIESMDLLIASHALSEGLILVTNNEKEFRKVQNLRIENWT